MFGLTTVICVVYGDQQIELTREHFPSIIFTTFDRLSWQECIDELKSLFGDKAPSYKTVKNWFNEFNCARRSLKDEIHEVPPKTAVVLEKIGAVQELIMQDRHVTNREMEDGEFLPPTYIGYFMNTGP